MRLKVRHQVRRVWRRAIVVGETPRVLCRASRDVTLARATAASPPASRCIRRCGSVIGTTTEVGRREARDVNPGVLDLLNPLLDLRGVQRRGLIERRVVLRTQSRS